MLEQVAGYSGLLLSVPTVLYEIVAYVVPGLTRSERQLLAPIIFGSSILFYIGYASCWLCEHDQKTSISLLVIAPSASGHRLTILAGFSCPSRKYLNCFGLNFQVACRLLFSYEILSPAALTFFVSYAEGAVESLWSIDQYFEFILVLMLSTGLAFQVIL